MNIGIIGFGSIGQRHYKNLKRLAKNIDVLSKRTDLDFAAAKDWKEFLECGPYDGIIIANETSKHFETLKKCIGITKSIFIEKPIFHSLDGLAKLSAEIKRKKINLWVGYNFHFFEPLLKIKKIIQSKKLGKIYYMRVSVGQDLRGWRPGRDYSKIYSAKKEKGGGVVLDLVHDINYPAWLLDDKLTPKRSYVKKISDFKINTEDFAESIFTGQRTGVIVSAHQDYLRIPGKRGLEIAGSKGSLIWDGLNKKIYIETLTGTKTEDASVDGNDMYKSEIKFFINKIKRGRRFSNFEEAVRDLKNIEFIKKYGK